jgi:hypothetical protein
MSRDRDCGTYTQRDDERGTRADPGPMHGQEYCRRPPD